MPSAQTACHSPSVHVLVPTAVPGEAVGHQHEVAVLVRVGAGARGLPPHLWPRLLPSLLGLAGLHPGVALLCVAGGHHQPLGGGGGGGQHTGGVSPSPPRPRHSHSLDRLRRGWLLLLWLGSLQKRVVEKRFEVDSVFGITFEKVNKEVSELGGGSGRNSRSQLSIFLVELLERLRCLGLQEILPSLYCRENEFMVELEIPAMK